MSADNRDDLGFGHLKCLRKAIVKKKTGALYFSVMRGVTRKLVFRNGQLSRHKGCENLVLFLSHANVLDCRWENYEVQHNDFMPPYEAMQFAIENVEWSDADIAVLVAMYSRLPSLDVSWIAVVFDNKLTDLSYNLLYSKLSCDKDYNISEFLLKNKTANLLINYRVRVLTFDYVLGLIKARKQVSKSELMVRESTISRIMKRIQGIA